MSKLFGTALLLQQAEEMTIQLLAIAEDMDRQGDTAVAQIDLVRIALAKVGAAKDRHEQANKMLRAHQSVLGELVRDLRGMTGIPDPDANKI